MSLLGRGCGLLGRLDGLDLLGLERGLGGLGLLGRLLGGLLGDLLLGRGVRDGRGVGRGHAVVCGDAGRAGLEGCGGARVVGGGVALRRLLVDRAEEDGRDVLFAVAGRRREPERAAAHGRREQVPEHTARGRREHGVVVRAADLVALRVDDGHLGARLLVENDTFCGPLAGWAAKTQASEGAYVPRMRGSCGGFGTGEKYGTRRT